MPNGGLVPGEEQLESLLKVPAEISVEESNEFVCCCPPTIPFFSLCSTPMNDPDLEPPPPPPDCWAPLPRSSLLAEFNEENG
jgi:hypothetical protein